LPQVAQKHLGDGSWDFIGRLMLIGVICPSFPAFLPAGHTVASGSEAGTG